MINKSIKKKYYGLLLVVLSIILFAPYSVKALAYPVTFNDSSTNIYKGSFRLNNSTSLFTQGLITGSAIYASANQAYDSFNAGRYSFSLNNGFQGVYNVSFTLAYAYRYEAPDNTPIVTFDQISCQRVNVVNISPDDGSGFLSQMATYTCYGFIYDNNHFIDFAGVDYSWLGLHNIVDIAGTEGETLYYLQQINNQLSNFGYSGLSDELRQNNNYNRQQIENSIYSNSQSIISNQNANSQAEQSAINNNTQAIEDINDTLNDDSIDTTDATGFFNNFQDNDHGLSSIITAPLNFIRNLASSSCTPISLTIPFVNTQFNLPCMSTIYRQNFSSLFTLYQTITFGIVAYYVCVKIFGIVKGFKNPDNDRIEVLDL